MLSSDTSTQKSKPKPPIIRYIFRPNEISGLRSLSNPEIPTHRDDLVFLLSPSKLNLQQHYQTLIKIPRLCTSSIPTSISSMSAVVINNNEDLLTLILVRLPSKSLIRFQCVSKHWFSIISNPTFRRLHCRQYPAMSSSSSALISLFLFRKIYGINELNFISFRKEDVNSMSTITSKLSNFTNGEIMRLHSCNGLLCIEFLLSNDIRRYVVCNPTTSQFRIIAQYKIREGPQTNPVMNIVFDPLKSDYYKLIGVWVDHLNDQFRFLVYSSETAVWSNPKKSIKMQNFIDTYFFENGVLWNGNLYWFSESNSTLCFDLDNQRLSCIEPCLGMQMSKCGSWWFGESGGHLHVIMVNLEMKSFIVFELVILRNRPVWVFRYDFDLAPLTSLYPSMMVKKNSRSDELRCSFHIPYFLLDEKDKIARVMISLEGKIIYYDIKHNNVMELADVKPVHGCRYRGISKYKWKDAYQFVKTLASV